MEILTEAIVMLNDTLVKSSTSIKLSEWIMVGITAIYVIATILICLFNYRSAMATRKQVQEQKRQFDEVNRPNIDITFECIRNGLICIKIENTGRKLAKNVKLVFNKDFIESIQKIGVNTKSLIELSRSIFTLGIGQKLFADICSDIYLKQYKGSLLKIDFSYEDNQQQLYTDHAIIDLNQYNWVEKYDSPLKDIGKYQKENNEMYEKELKLMREAVDLIKRGLQKDS